MTDDKIASELLEGFDEEETSASSKDSKTSKAAKTSKAKTTKKANSTKDKVTYDDASYEHNLTNLQDIVERLESDNLPLDQLIEEYKNGLQIIRQMQAQLLDAKEIIEASNLESNINDLEEDIRINNARLGVDPNNYPNMTPEMNGNFNPGNQMHQGQGYPGQAPGNTYHNKNNQGNSFMNNQGYNNNGGYNGGGNNGSGQW